MTPDDQLRSYLEALFDAGGTDLLICAGSPPRMRVGMRMAPIPGFEVLSASEVTSIVRSALSEEERTVLTSRREVDFSLSWEGKARLRGNAFHQRDSAAMALRLLPFRVPTLAELHLPPAVEQMARQPSGILLVTGPAGSGKSTTLAAIIDSLNRTRPCHILTIEDPIEYLHRHDIAAVNQREVGRDTESFVRGLRSALRENPDVLMIGEIRDPESGEIALNMAETGHLVLATLHSNDSSQAIDRMVGMYGTSQQAQVSLQLANSLAGVVYQRMLPRIDGGQVPAFEVLLPSSGVRTQIGENKTRQLRNSIVMGRREGMQTLEDSLSVLVRDRVVAYEEAVARSLFPNEIEKCPPAASRQTGDTLIELLVAVVLMGLTVVAIIGGLASAVRLSGLHRSQADVSAALVAASEYLKSVPYVPCSTTSNSAGIATDDINNFNTNFNTVSPLDPGVTAPSVAEVTDSSGTQCSALSTDPGLEEIWIQASAPGENVTQTIYLIKADNR